MNYLIYDVETPNRHNDSICACAWMLHDGTKELDFGYQLIDPQAPFDPKNTSIHHICAFDVCNSPTFSEYWDTTLNSLFSNNIVVAHNASFDMSVTSKALIASGRQAPKAMIIDSLSVFKSLLPEDSCKLCDLASRYGFSYKQHDAGADVRALAEVINRYMREKGLRDYASFFESAFIHPTIYSFESMGSNVSKRVSREDSLANSETIINEARSKNIDLTDIHFAFHGELLCPAISREDGLDIIVEALGGAFHKSISKKVDYYVCFDNKVTGTVQKALTLAEDPSSNIQIIDTLAFFNLLGHQTDMPDHDGPRKIRERKAIEKAAREAEKAKPKRSVMPTVLPIFGACNFESVYNTILNMSGNDAENVTLNRTQSGGSIYMYKSVAFTIVLNSRSQVIKTNNPTAVDYASKIPGASSEKGVTTFPLGCDIKYTEVFENMVRDVYDSNLRDVDAEMIGCCDMFIMCSDALSCLKSDDPHYNGCLYRKNLEAGRIFYGKNKNI